MKRHRLLEYLSLFKTNILTNSVFKLHINKTHSDNKEQIYEIRLLFSIAVMPIASENTIKMGLKQVCRAILNKTDPVCVQIKVKLSNQHSGASKHSCLNRCSVKSLGCPHIFTTHIRKLRKRITKRQLTQVSRMLLPGC